MIDTVRIILVDSQFSGQLGEVGIELLIGPHVSFDFEISSFSFLLFI